MRVRARDGLGQVDQNEVVLSILLGLRRVSNSAEEIVVDGVLDDWLDLEPLGADPDDLVASLDGSDATMLWMGDHDGDLYVGVDVEGIYDRGGQNLIFIDADRDPSTGFGRDLAFGADYLVRDQQVYSYQGAGQSWDWATEGSAVLGAGDDGEMAFPLRWIGDPSEFEVIFNALTEPNEYAPNTGDAAGGERYLYVVSDPQILGAASFQAVPIPQPPPPPPLGPLRFRAPEAPPEPQCKQRAAALRGPQACRLRR